MTRCNTPHCVLVLGHTGAHTAAPSRATLGKQAEQRRNDEALMHLDFPTPWYADLNDEDTA